MRFSLLSPEEKKKRRERKRERERHTQREGRKGLWEGGKEKGKERKRKFWEAYSCLALKIENWKLICALCNIRRTQLPFTLK